MNKSSILVIFFVAFLIFDVFLIGYYITKFRSKKSTPGTISSLQKKESQIIAKVGEENIYQSDLDYELENHPQKNDPEIKQKLMDKIILDSVILQGGAADGFVNLNSDTFNSQNKNYAERVNMVDLIKNKVESNNKTLKGTVIAIMFRNNDYIGPLGLEKSKQIAFEKISALHKQIVDKKITIDQAGTNILNDTSLRQIDTAWRNNAISHFSVSDNKPITSSPEFDTIIRNLEQGEISEVYLARNSDGDPEDRYEALYLVAQVTEKLTGTQKTDYNTWIAQKKNTYAVKLY